MSVLHWIRGSQASVSGPIPTGTCTITCKHQDVRRMFDDARLEIRDATRRVFRKSSQVTIFQLEKAMTQGRDGNSFHSLFERYNVVDHISGDCGDDMNW